MAPTASVLEFGDFPKRVVDAARAGLTCALTGRSSVISERLWAYEVEEAARHLLGTSGLTGLVGVQTNGETVVFRPLRRAVYARTAEAAASASPATRVAVA